MKLIILAFIISITIHILLFNNYKNEKIMKENQSNQEEIIKKSEIKYVKIKKQEPKKIEQKTNEILKKSDRISKIEKPKKEPIKKAEPKKVITKNDIKYQEKRKTIQKAQEFQKEVLKEQVVENKPTIQEKTLENFLTQKDPVNPEILNKLQRLYGREYETFTKVQKAYLEKNINNFQVITQRVLDRLGYPKIAAKLRLSGTNIVEFMFHPDGSISNLKITNSSGYAVFDDYSIELIEIAYKDYPRPTTTTKLKFNVTYSLY